MLFYESVTSWRHFLNHVDITFDPVDGEGTRFETFRDVSSMHQGFIAMSLHVAPGVPDVISLQVRIFISQLLSAILHHFHRLRLESIFIRVSPILLVIVGAQHAVHLMRSIPDKWKIPVCLFVWVLA
jgi:hypothetical protein